MKKCDLCSEDLARRIHENSLYPFDFTNRIEVIGEHTGRLNTIYGATESDYLKALEYEEAMKTPDRYVIKQRPKGAVSEEYRMKMAISPRGRKLSVQNYVQLYEAVSFVNWSGAFLNCRVTISWPLLGCDNEFSSRLKFKQFTKCFRSRCDEWWGNECKYVAGNPAMWIYTHEQSEGGNFHTHMLLHMPPKITPLFRRWVRSFFRLPKRGAASARAGHPILIRADHSVKNAIKYQWLRFGYLLKGADYTEEMGCCPHTGRIITLGDLLPWQYQPSGEIIGKKICGMSENLAWAARCNAGYTKHSPIRKRKLDVRVLYSDQVYLMGQQLRCHAEFRSMIASLQNL